MALILVADDEDVVRNTLRIMLEDAGHTVLQARDGRMAVEVAKVQSFDVMFCDIIMPEQEGIETIGAVRRKFPTVRVIAMSGGRRSITSAFNLESARLMGVKVTLTKPFTHTALNSALREALA